MGKILPTSPRVPLRGVPWLIDKLEHFLGLYYGLHNLQITVSTLCATHLPHTGFLHCLQAFEVLFLELFRHFT